MTVLQQLTYAIATDRNRRGFRLGQKLGELWTDYGLPLDMSLARLDLSKTQKIAVLNGALASVISHKKSGATDKALERTRRANKQALVRFIERGEVEL